MNKLILTSRGLTTDIGKKLIGAELAKHDLSGKKIFLFHEPNYFTENMLREACMDMGFEENNIIFSSESVNINDVVKCDFFYCTEGNVFEVLDIMRERKVDNAIKLSFANGNKVYIGASAGASVVGASIEELSDFDKNFVGMKDFTSLGFFDGLIIPHYEEEHLVRYIENSPGITEKYNNIINISDEGIFVAELS